MWCLCRSVLTTHMTAQATEFRDDVVRVARKREPGVGLDQIANDFGIHFTTLYSGMKKAELDDGDRTGPQPSQQGRSFLVPLEVTL